MKGLLFWMLFIGLFLTCLQVGFGAHRDVDEARSDLDVSQHARYHRAPSHLQHRMSSHGPINFLMVVIFALSFGLLVVESVIFFIFDICRGTWYLSLASFVFSLLLLGRLKQSREGTHGHTMLRLLGKMQNKIGLGEFYTRFHLFCLFNLSGRVLHDSRGMWGIVGYVTGSMCCLVFIAMSSYWFAIVLPFMLSYLFVASLTFNTVNIIEFGKAMKGPNTQNDTINSIID